MKHWAGTKTQICSLDVREPACSVQSPLRITSSFVYFLQCIYSICQNNSFNYNFFPFLSVPYSISFIIMCIHSWTRQVFLGIPSWVLVQRSLVFWRRKELTSAMLTTRARVPWTWWQIAPCCSSSRGSPRSTGTNLQNQLWNQRVHF